MWNISGLDKGKETWEFIEKHDIVILIETWLEKGKEEKRLNKLNKNFEWLTKPAYREKKKGRAKGGQLIGLRKGNDVDFKAEEWEYGVKIRYKRGEKEGVIVSVYNNEGMTKTIEKLEEIMEESISEGKAMILLGDLNSRIGTESARTDMEGEEEWKRNSEDTTSNNEGKKLIRLCQEYGLTVMNGRIKGDEKGKLTYIGTRGNSVIDYLIVKEQEEIPIKEMRVHRREESDHLPLILKTDWNSKRLETRKIEDRWRWKEEMKEEFQEYIRNQWESTQGATTQDKLTAINEIIEKAAEHTGMKRKGKGKRKDWYDAECKELRRKVRADLARFRNTTNEINKKRYSDSRRILKILIKKKKEERDKENWEEVESSKDTREFWKAIRKYRPGRHQTNENIKNEEWISHFKGLLEGETESEPQVNAKEASVEEVEEDTNNEEDLNADISETEVRREIRKMKNCKAPGEDRIINEFYKNLPKEAETELANTINNLWRAGELGANWNKGQIFPIFKAGNEKDTQNYRGISLLNGSYKILAGIMAERIRNWLEKNKKLRESQAGFRRGYATRDHIFVLNALVENKLKKRRGKVYAFFVDLKAAFDKVNREILFGKLQRIGITGRMYKMIRAIYENTTNTVKTNNGNTECFRTFKGVRQGCPLSPTLFNIYINDMEEEWEANKIGGAVIGNLKVYCLKFADDVAILAEDLTEFQQMIKALEKYNRRNKLELNVKKSKIMIFRKGGRIARAEKFIYAKEEIEIVNKFKYLGYWFTAKNSTTEHIKRQAEKVQKVTNITWGIMKRARIRSLKRKMYLFDTLIKSVILYGSEVWGWRERQKIEIIQGRYTKMALGISKNTPDYIWRMETGRPKMNLQTLQILCRYTAQIYEMEDYRWPRKCLMAILRSVENNNPMRWGAEMRETFKETGSVEILRLLRERGNKENIEKGIEDMLRKKSDQEIQTNWRKIDKSSFCQHYKTIKEGIEEEKYLSDEKTTEWEKIQWARMRCGNLERFGKKGMPKWHCRACQNEDEEESFKHIWNCPQVKNNCKRELRNWIQAMKQKHKNENWMINMLKGRVLKEACRYSWEFQKTSENGGDK